MKKGGRQRERERHAHSYKREREREMKKGELIRETVTQQDGDGDI